MLKIGFGGLQAVGERRIDTHSVLSFYSRTVEPVVKFNHVICFFVFLFAVLLDIWKSLLFFFFFFLKSGICAALSACFPFCSDTAITTHHNQRGR